MAEQSGNGPRKIYVTGRSAFPGELSNSYVMTAEPKPSILQRAIGAIGSVFMNLLPDRGGRADVVDDSLVIKTSPTIWEYEMFRLEWDRRSILRDIDQILKDDPRIKRANRVAAAVAVRKGLTVTVSSDISEDLAAKAQDIVNALMRDCQVNAKLASWARILLKEGDLFLNPVVDVNTKRIKNLKRLPAISMQRCDDMQATFRDLNKAFRQIDPISLAILEEFPLWAINHIRYDHEEGERYGNSQYLQLRGYWKKLQMTEEDLVVRRRTRAIPRRLHSVGTKDNPGSWTQVEDYKTHNQLNAKTSQITTDYYGNGLTDVKTLDGDAHLDHIADIEHLQEVYMIGTGVPLHMIGFGADVNRDIVEDQIKQFKEETQELRDLLENGDSSPYSGLRFIFNFALALQGIDPTLVDYNMTWYADDNESAAERVDRVIKLRGSAKGAQLPKPLVSQKRAMQIIAADIGLDNEDSIEAELQEIDAEQSAKTEQAMAAAQAAVKSASETTEETEPEANADEEMVDAARSKKKAHPLRGRRFARMELRAAREVRAQFRAVLTAARPELDRIAELYDHLTDNEHRGRLVDQVLDAMKASMGEQLEERVRSHERLYRRAAAYGAEVAAGDAPRPRAITDDPTPPPPPPVAQTVEEYINPETVLYLQQQAGTRIRGIDETTLQAVRRELSEAYAEGERFPHWLERIEAVMNCNVPQGRAEMIARTELAFAYSAGLFGTYRDLGVERVQWLAVMDWRTCERCAERHEQTFRLTEVEHQLPLHPRCRCTVVGVYND